MWLQDTHVTCGQDQDQVTCSCYMWSGSLQYVPIRTNMGQHGQICANIYANKCQYGSKRTSGRPPKLFVYSSSQNSRSHPYAAESSLGCFKVALVIVISSSVLHFWRFAVFGMPPILKFLTYLWQILLFWAQMLPILEFVAYFASLHSPPLPPALLKFCTFDALPEILKILIREAMRRGKLNFISMAEGEFQMTKF